MPASCVFGAIFFVSLLLAGAVALVWCATKPRRERHAHQATEHDRRRAEIAEVLARTGRRYGPRPRLHMDLPVTSIYGDQRAKERLMAWERAGKSGPIGGGGRFTSANAAWLALSKDPAERDYKDKRAIEAVDCQMGADHQNYVLEAAKRSVKWQAYKQMKDRAALYRQVDTIIARQQGKPPPKPPLEADNGRQRWPADEPRPFTHSEMERLGEYQLSLEWRLRSKAAPTTTTARQLRRRAIGQTGAVTAIATKPTPEVEALPEEQLAEVVFAQPFVTERQEGPLVTASAGEHSVLFIVGSRTFVVDNAGDFVATVEEWAEANGYQLTWNRIGDDRWQARLTRP